jgi:hypothetical protein
MISRRGPPENINFRERGFPDKREKYREEPFSQEGYDINLYNLYTAG